MIEAGKILQDLVRLPSVNPMGRELPKEITLEHRVTAYLEDFFRKLNVPYERQTTAPGRDNIVARCDIPGAKRTLMLEAHQDTVPVDNMTIEPFGGHVENGKLYGRGACDIKGGMASMLWAFARVAKEKPRGAANVIMACSVDEEHTFYGVQELAKRGPRADLAVIAEPTQLNIVHAHKGVVRWNMLTTGRSCHSSSPEQGVNAIYRMGRLVQAIEKYAAHLRTTHVDPLLGPATLSVGMISGGTSVNTVPDRCRIEIDRRVICGEDPLKSADQLMAYLKEQNLDFRVECEQPWMAKGALTPELSGELVKLLGQAIDSVVKRHEVQVVPYGTDASTLAEVGIPSVVFGPGDIARAHTKDEWVPLDEVEKAGEILYRLACQC